MKLLKLISHPYTVIICFCLIMISGEHLGGCYALYILIGLPFGAVHAWLGLAGIIALLISYYRFKNKTVMGQAINVFGVLLLFASIYYFFWADRKHYNWGSFEQAVPLISMAISALVSICFIARSFIASQQKMISVQQT